MTIGPVGYGVYGMYGMYGAMSGVTGTGAVSGSEKTGAIVNPGESMEKISPGRRSSPAECETCRERKYQDGSDEMVSFKSAAHISPEASAARVMSHEMEHVANAYEKAEQKGGRVVSCGVSLKTAVCPECGRSYVAGGLTRTSIAYPDEKNPYNKDLKAVHGMALRGANLDLAG